MATRANKNGKKKTADKTAVSPLNGARLPLGAHAGNTGGKPGRSGRKPNAFIDECERLTDAIALPKIAAYLIASTPDDQAWRWCVEYVSKYTKTEAPKRVIPEDGQGGPARFTLVIGNPLAVA